MNTIGIGVSLFAVVFSFGLFYRTRPSETAGGWVCIPENVSGMWVDHAEVESGLLGVREAFPERPDCIEGSKTSYPLARYLG